jgi:putative membrane protein insertion efficiency factor
MPRAGREKPFDIDDGFELYTSKAVKVNDPLKPEASSGPRRSFGLAAGLPVFSLWPRRIAHILIRAYQLSLSAFIGRRCRYLPTCSDYTDEAIARHGLWAGGFIGLARLCRCHPWGGAGYDPVPAHTPSDAHWARPWRYGQWRQTPACDAVDAETTRPPK